MLIGRLAALLLVLSGVFFNSVEAASTDDGFYKGKTIRLIVAFSAGGGYDTYSRTIARHLSKYIPGNPSVVVDNMTGAGGIIHANYMFKQAKPDGLTIGNNSGGLFLQQVMGAKGIEFDGRRVRVSRRTGGGSFGLCHRQSQRRDLDGSLVRRQGAGALRRRRPRRFRVGLAAGVAGGVRIADPRHRRIQRHFGYSTGDRERRAGR